MKKLFTTAVILAALLAVPAAAFANNEKVTIHENALIAGQFVPKGQYFVSWKQDGTRTTVAFRQAGELIARAEAEISNTPKTLPETYVRYAPTDRGVSIVREIRLDKKTLRFDDGAASATASAAN